MKSQITCPCCGTTHDRVDEAPEFNRVEKSGDVTKHTAGPWDIIQETLDRIDIITCDKDGDPNGRIACIIRVAWCNADEENANAQLIAAAPDLLEACRVALIQIRQDNDDRKSEHRLTQYQIEAAINKATRYTL